MTNSRAITDRPNTRFVWHTDYPNEDPNLKETFPTGSIYKLYLPVGIVGKYIGILPLRELYEFEVVPNLVYFFFLCILLPALSFFIQVYAAYNAFTHLNKSYSCGGESGVTILACGLWVVCRYSRGVSCTAILYLKSKKLLATLAAFDKIDHLFAPKLRRLQLVVYSMSFGFVGMYGFPPVIEYFVSHKGHLQTEDCIGNILIGSSFSITIITYIMFQYVMFISLQSLNRSLRCHILSDEGFAYDLHVKLQNIRREFQSVFDLGRDVDDFLAPTILIILMVNTVEISVTMYYAILIVKMEYIFVLLTSTITTTGFCLMAHSTASEAAKVKSFLYAVKLPKNTPHVVANEINLLAHMFRGQPLTSTASDYFQIDKSLFSKIISIVVTYVIIMIQFHDSMEAVS